METFSSSFESYVLGQAKPNRIILAERPVPGGGPMPWTWVRVHGKGRVYYTASEHDTRTWSRPAFQNQLAVAVHWSAGTVSTGLKPGPAVPGSGSREVRGWFIGERWIFGWGRKAWSVNAREFDA